MLVYQRVSHIVPFSVHSTDSSDTRGTSFWAWPRPYPRIEATPSTTMTSDSQTWANLSISKRRAKIKDSLYPAISSCRNILYIVL